MWNVEFVRVVLLLRKVLRSSCRNMTETLRKLRTFWHTNRWFRDKNPHAFLRVLLALCSYEYLVGQALWRRCIYRAMKIRRDHSVRRLAVQLRVFYLSKASCFLSGFWNECQKVIGMITLRWPLMIQRMYSSQECLFIVCKALTFCGDGLLASCPDSDSKVENCPLSNVREGTFSKFECHV